MLIPKNWLLCGCVALLAGCSEASYHPDPMPSALFLDVTASTQWKSTHEVYASWDDHEVKLPACITFKNVPNLIGHSIYLSDGKVQANFGSMRMTITAKPGSDLTAIDSLAEPQANALRQAGIEYWTFSPLAEADRDPARTLPTPTQLQTRGASGEVQNISVASP